MSKVVPLFTMCLRFYAFNIITVFGGFASNSNMSNINYLGDPNRALITAQLDPRGDSGQGSPIGGLVFSNAFASSNGTGQNVQAVEWDR
jgi:hypothetical protein